MDGRFVEKQIFVEQLIGLPESDDYVFKIKKMINTIQFDIGERLTAKRVKDLIGKGVIIIVQ